MDASLPPNPPMPLQFQNYNKIYSRYNKNGKDCVRQAEMVVERSNRDSNKLLLTRIFYAGCE
jgi:hypothetical protein